MSFASVAGAAAVGVGGKLLASSMQKTAKPVYQEKLDWQAEQKKAIEGNLATLPQAQQLSAATNTFNQSEANRLMEAAIPGWIQLQAQQMKTAQGLLTNPYEMSSEQEDYIARKAAERGISAGTRGQFSDFSYLRDFGQSSTQVGLQKIAAASNITQLLASTAPRVNPMSPLSMFVTPTQIAQAQQQHVGRGSGHRHVAFRVHALLGVRRHP